MKKNIVFLSCVVFLACSGKKNSTIPATILTEQKMAAVMADIHLLEAALGSNFLKLEPQTHISKNKDTTVLTVKDQKDNMVLELLKKNNVSSEEYKRSYIFYTAHPELLTEVYRLVINNLSELQAKVAAEKYVSPADSIGIKSP